MLLISIAVTLLVKSICILPSVNLQELKRNEGVNSVISVSSVVHNNGIGDENRDKSRHVGNNNGEATVNSNDQHNGIDVMLNDGNSIINKQARTAKDAFRSTGNPQNSLPIFPERADAVYFVVAGKCPSI